MSAWRRSNVEKKMGDCGRDRMTPKKSGKGFGKMMLQLEIAIFQLHVACETPYKRSKKNGGRRNTGVLSIWIF